MRARSPFRRLRIAVAGLLCLVALADETAVDKEIMKNLDFFSQMELVEMMPMMQDFGIVIDIATERKGKAAAAKPAEPAAAPEEPNDAPSK